MILPEDIINNYQFENNDKLDDLKQHLINHYNTLTLRHYKDTNEFLTQDDILKQMPNLIIKFYTQQNQSINKPVLKPKGFWAENVDCLETFKTFLSNHYNTVDCPTTKFKDLMIHYEKESGVEVSQTWCAKYETLCNQLNIQYKKIVDPRYKNSTGVCFVFLKSKVQQKVVVNKKFDGIIPDIPTGVLKK
jgi:hypothetical protein